MLDSIFVWLCPVSVQCRPLYLYIKLNLALSWAKGSPFGVYEWGTLSASSWSQGCASEGLGVCGASNRRDLGEQT